METHGGRARKWWEWITSHGPHFFPTPAAVARRSGSAPGSRESSRRRKQAGRLRLRQPWDDERVGARAHVLSLERGERVAQEPRLGLGERGRLLQRSVEADVALCTARGWAPWWGRPSTTSCGSTAQSTGRGRRTGNLSGYPRAGGGCASVCAAPSRRRSGPCRTRQAFRERVAEAETG